MINLLAEPYWEIVNVLEVAEVKPVELAVRVLSPVVPLTIILVNVAIPNTGATLVVGPFNITPELPAILIVLVAFSTVLPKASLIRTATGGAKAAPEMTLVGGWIKTI